MGQFVSQLKVVEVGFIGGRVIWELLSPLEYQSNFLGLIVAPTGFQTDFCSIPRHPAPIYGWLGGKLNRQGTIHDLAYCIDAGFTYEQANLLIKEACVDHYEDETCMIDIEIIYDTLVECGRPHYHQRLIMDRLV